MPPPIKRSRSRQPGRGGGSARQRPAPPPRRRLRSRSARPGRPAPCAPLRCCSSPCSRSGPCPAAPPAPSSLCPSGPTRTRCPPAGRQVGDPCPTPFLPPLRAPPVLYKPLPHPPSRIPRRAPPPRHRHPRPCIACLHPPSPAPREPPRAPRLAGTGTGTGTGSAAGCGAVPAGPGLRQGGACGPEVTGDGGGWRWGLGRLRLRGTLLCSGGDVAPGPGGALRGDALRYLSLRAGECPHTPLSLGDPPGPGSAGEGAGKEGVRLLFSIRCSSHGRGKRDSFSQPDTWMSSPAAWGRRRGI